MTTANTDAFPVKSTEHSIVDPAVNSVFKKFETRTRVNKMMTNLKHMVSSSVRLKIKQVQVR